MRTERNGKMWVLVIEDSNEEMFGTFISDSLENVLCLSAVFIKEYPEYLYEIRNVDKVADEDEV